MAKKHPSTIAEQLAAGLRSDYDINELRKSAKEQMRRECESLRLYEPMPFQDAFHRCRAAQAVMQKGNRAGGTASLMVEVARAVTGQDPYSKYPKENGRAYVLGYGEKHIGRVFHKYLFRAGVFSIIRDEHTKKWRAYRPWMDKHREAEKKPAPPLIPKRFIKSLSWEKKSEYVFSLVTFINGWELHAMNSSGDSGQAQGFDAHLYAIDEDLATANWYEEAQGRIAACGGLLRWAALPHAKNNDLMRLLELAENNAGNPDPTAVVFRASILDNKFIDQESVKRSVEGWKALGDDVYRKRVMGEIVLDSVLMYPTYNRRIHSAIRREGEQETEVQRIMRERQGEPPDDWTRFMIVDPGHTVCAVLFCATPPPEIGRQRVIYQEAYIRNANASHFGEALDLYARDKVFEKFIIDMHGANLTSSGDGIRPLEHYTAELVKRGLKCEQTESAFSAGCDRIGLREECLRNWLAIERDGQPTLLIVNERCPNLCIEMERFRKKTTRIAGQDVPLDEGNRRANTHAIECAEYFAADGGEYIKPRTHAIELSHVDRVLALDAKRERIQRHMAATFGKSHSINLGPQGVPVT
jgi:hypothetical protein